MKSESGFNLAIASQPFRLFICTERALSGLRNYDDHPGIPSVRLSEIYSSQITTVIKLRLYQDVIGVFLLDSQMFLG